MHILQALTITSLLQGARAFKSINFSTSYNVSAGVDTEVQIVNDSNDATAVNYTVGLYSSVVNFPICQLIPSVPISTTSFKINIPPSVGPEGFYYRLYVISFTSSGQGILPSPSYSDPFYLYHGTGILSSLEIPTADSPFFGGGLYGQALPCVMYDCERQCAKANPPTTSQTGTYQPDTTVYDSRYIACLQACPGAPDPIPAETVFATTTTGTGALPTATASNIIANASCNVGGGETFCGSQCCARDVYCYHWNTCDSGTTDLSANTTETTSSSSLTSMQTSTPTRTASATLSQSPSGSSPTAAKSGAGRMKLQISGWELLMMLGLGWLL